MYTARMQVDACEPHKDLRARLLYYIVFESQAKQNHHTSPMDTSSMDTYAKHLYAPQECRCLHVDILESEHQLVLEWYPLQSTK